MEIMILDALIDSMGPLAGREVLHVSPVGGGSIHKAFKLEFRNQLPMFLKISSLENSNMLQFEIEALQMLEEFVDKSLLLIPQPIGFHLLPMAAVLILPWMDFSPGKQFQLGKGLAMMHKASSESGITSFGCSNNGFIGLTVQLAGWNRSWGECFVDFRLKYQMKMAKSWGLDIGQYDEMLELLTSYLNEHNPVPSLVHGDLWSGNAGMNNDGRGIIFDPATWWADREVDLAMTKLFGGFSNEFYLGYEEIWPTDPSFEKRLEIYNLYHILNHANMFGGHYKEQSVNGLNQLLKLFN